MPIYLGDYLADTFMLSHAEHGAYLLSIFAYWRKGSALTIDEFKRVVGDEFETVSKFFELRDNQFHHERVESELANSLNKKKLAQENGKKGGNPLLKKGETNPYYETKDNQEDNPKDNRTVIPEDNLEDNPDHNQKITREINSSPSPSPSPSSLSSSKPSVVLGERIKKSASPPPNFQDFVNELKNNLAYENINVEIECAKMDAWLQVNKHRKKTKRFVVNWLNRATDKSAEFKPEPKKIDDVDKQMTAYANQIKKERGWI